METVQGTVIILNGAPRSGKSSIAAELVRRGSGQWANIGVDSAIAGTPTALRPGIGLRPGGERPDIEAHLPELFSSLYTEVAERSNRGLHTAVDVGHHDSYRSALSPWPTVVRLLADRPVMIVGVRCPVEEILRRRASSGETLSGQRYLQANADGSAPAPVLRWQREVHRPGMYDLEVETGSTDPETCAAQILRHLGFAMSGARTCDTSSSLAGLDAIRRLSEHYGLQPPPE